MSNTIAFVLVGLDVFISSYLLVVGLTTICATLIIARYGIQCSNSQYAKAGSAFGETAIGVKYVKAVSQATDKSSSSGTVPLTGSELGCQKLFRQPLM